MDQAALHRLIEDGQLEEALSLLAEHCQGSHWEKEARLLKARYHGLCKERDNGLISWEQFSLEHNRVLQAAINLAGREEDGPAPASSWRRAILLSIAALIAAGSLLYYQSGQSTAAAELQASLPEKAIEAQPPAIDIVAEVEYALAGQELNFIFSGLSFSADRHYQSFLARLTRRFLWKASIPCRLEERDIRITYDTAGQRMIAVAGPIHLLGNLYVYDKQNTTVANAAWLEENANDGEFWQNINGTTQEMANQRLRSDAAMRQSLKATAESLVKGAILRTFAALPLDSLEVEVMAPEVVLYDGGRVAL